MNTPKYNNKHRLKMLLSALVTLQLSYPHKGPGIKVQPGDVRLSYHDCVWWRIDWDYSNTWLWSLNRHNYTIQYFFKIFLQGTNSTPVVYVVGWVLINQHELQHSNDYNNDGKFICCLHMHWVASNVCCCLLIVQKCLYPRNTAICKVIRQTVLR